MIWIYFSYHVPFWYLPNALDIDRRWKRWKVEKGTMFHLKKLILNRTYNETMKLENKIILIVKLLYPRCRATSEWVHSFILHRHLCCRQPEIQTMAKVKVHLKMINNINSNDKYTIKDKKSKIKWIEWKYTYRNYPTIHLVQDGRTMIIGNIYLKLKKQHYIFVCFQTFQILPNRKIWNVFTYGLLRQCTVQYLFTNFIWYTAASYGGDKNMISKFVHKILKTTYRSYMFDLIVRLLSILNCAKVPDLCDSFYDTETMIIVDFKFILPCLERNVCQGHRGKLFHH